MIDYLQCYGARGINLRFPFLLNLTWGYIFEYLPLHVPYRAFKNLFGIFKIKGCFMTVKGGMGGGIENIQIMRASYLVFTQFVGKIPVYE